MGFTCLYLANAKGFWSMPLARGLEAAGCTLIWNQWAPSTETLAQIDCCIVNFNEAIRHSVALWALKRRLPKHTPIIGIDRDAPWQMGFRRRRLRLLAWLKVIDIYATHTLQPLRFTYAPQTLYLPNAADTRDYNLGKTTLEALRRPDGYQYDVSFVGNLNGIRYKEHAERARFIAALEQRLQALGINSYFRDTKDFPHEDQTRLVQTSRINLNYRSSADHGPEKSWGLPERCYGVPARGGFLLSDERRHAQDDFVLGKEWVSFDSMEDCVEKIRYYLDHFEESRAIAEAAHYRVMQAHTYEARAARLIEAIRQWKSQ
jgi:spore maturation protein CgeB